MPILASFVYNTPAKFDGRRATTWGFVVGWYNSFWVQTGRVSILQETKFGGYRAHITFKPNFWNWSSNGYTLDYMLQDFYVTAPGSSTPISGGTVYRSWFVESAYHNMVTVMAFSPNDGHYHWQKFPDRPPGFWAAPFNPTPASPFQTT